MANFPLLKTGAVTQYPLEITAGQVAHTVRFLDGSDQRYPMQGRLLRRWQIRLELLNESEMQALETFFEGQLAGYSTFAFPDPYSAVPVPNCRLGEDTLSSDFEAVDIGAISLWVIETNG